ncbi:MAG: DMT family transporter [Anaerolineae bacterium]
MTGEVAALGCAFCWALSSTLMRGLTDQMPSVLLNTLRSLVGTVLYALIILGTGKVSLYSCISIHDLAFVGINLAFGIVLGDTAYYSSMRLIGVSRALTISSMYPLLVALLAGVALGEQFSVRTWLGFMLCIAGVILVARSSLQRGNPRPLRQIGRGVGLAVAAAFLWSIGTVALRIGSRNIDAFVVNSIRLGGVTLIAGIWAGTRGEMQRTRVLGRRQWLPLVLAAIVGSVAGATLYVTSVQLAGASKAAVLASTAPLFSVPMSLLAGETVNARLIAGIVVAVTGVMLVV